MKDLRRSGFPVGAEGSQIFVLYFLLLAGGLWHRLGWFQTVMRLLAGAALIFLAVVLVWKICNAGRSASQRRRILIFSAVVLCCSHLIEWYGVRSGLVFGVYRYGNVLQPQLAGVPVAIGFAWVILVWASAALAQRILPQRWAACAPVMVLTIALLMTGFDRIMEPAAVKLGYWSWQEGSIPLQNYLAWFAISALFATAGWRLKLLNEQFPALAVHMYLAQGIYFFLAWGANG